jgi:hypothetical protein
MGTLLKSGLGGWTQKFSEIIIFKHLTRDNKATLKWGLQIRMVFCSSFPFFPCSNSKGAKNLKQSWESMKVGKTFNQVWNMWDPTILTELRVGLQIKLTLELAFPCE